MVTLEQGDELISTQRQKYNLNTDMNAVSVKITGLGHHDWK
jgi:hypothetical protein